MSSIKKIKLNQENFLNKFYKKHDFYEGFQLDSTKLNTLLKPRTIFAAFINTASTRITSRDQSCIVSQKNRNLKIGTFIYDYKIVFENKHRLIINKTNKHMDLTISFTSSLKKDFLVIKIENMMHFHNKLGVIHYTLLKPIYNFLLKKRLLAIERKLYVDYITSSILN